MSDWIKCSDKMPEEYESAYSSIKRSDYVLVVEAHQNGERTVGIARTLDGTWDVMVYPPCTVTHWMPYPEPPKEVIDDRQ